MNIKSLTRVAIFTALICVFTVVVPPIYIGGIPVTLQLLIIMVIGAILNPFEAFLSVFLYLVIGVIGIPVFSGYKSGFDALLSPTGGFLLSFPLATYLISLTEGKSTIRLLIVNLLFGILLTYIAGVATIAIFNKINFFAAFKTMLVFIPIDIGKAILAAIISKKIKFSVLDS